MFLPLLSSSSMNLRQSSFGSLSWYWLECVADGNRDWYVHVFRCVFSLVFVTDCFKIVEDHVRVCFREHLVFWWVACLFTAPLLHHRDRMMYGRFLEVWSWGVVAGQVLDCLPDDEAVPLLCVNTLSSDVVEQIMYFIQSI